MRYEINREVTTIYDSREEYFLIDTDQLDKVLKFNWRVDTRKGYVESTSHKIKHRRLHRYLLDTDSIIDHINRNPRDNRLSNLRICTTVENNRNRVYKNSKSGVQGVWIVNRNGKTKYRAAVWENGKRIHLGYFDTLEEAKRVREEKARELYKSYIPPLPDQS